MAFSVSALVKKSLTPLIALSALLMLGSGIWLVSLGQWTVLWPMVLALVFSPLAFPFLMLPAGFFAGVMQVAQGPYPRVARVCMILTFVYFISLLTGYMFFSLYLVRLLASPDLPSFWPAMIWAPSAAVLPWALFATKDRDNVLFTGMLLMMVCAAAIVLPVLVFHALAFWQAFWIFWGTMAALLCLQALYEQFFVARKKTEAPRAPE